VLRAIGASNGAVLGIVLAEGLLVGVISWLVSSLLALPISKLLSDAVGILFLRAPFSYVFSFAGVLLWLGLVLAIAGLSSALPAWNAMRLTVRDVLAPRGRDSRPKRRPGGAGRRHQRCDDRRGQGRPGPQRRAEPVKRRHRRRGAGQRGRPGSSRRAPTTRRWSRARRPRRSPRPRRASPRPRASISRPPAA
jgi:hypothetical protein